MKTVTDQKGFTLIELMIALGIATIIVLGLYAFLVDTQRSYLTVSSNEQGNRRVTNANNAILNYINQAGFASFYWRYNDLSLHTFKRSGNRCSVNRASNSGSEGDELGTWRDVCVDNDANNNSRLFVHFTGSSIEDQLPFYRSDLAAGLQQVKKNIQAQLGNSSDDESDNRSFVCSGESIDNSHEVVVELYLEPKSASGAAVPVYDLMCATVYDNGKVSSPEAYVVERNIERFDIRMYVCGTSGDTSKGYICSYLKPNEITASVTHSDDGRWDKGLDAVRYVLLQSEDSGQKVIKNKSEKFQPWPDEPWNVPAGDSRVRQIIANEAYLRNGGYGDN